MSGAMSEKDWLGRSTRELSGMIKMFSLDSGGSYTGVFICQNSSNYMCKIGTLYYILLYVNNISESWLKTLKTCKNERYNNCN